MLFCGVDASNIYTCIASQPISLPLDKKRVSQSIPFVGEDNYRSAKYTEKNIFHYASVKLGKCMRKKEEDECDDASVSAYRSENEKRTIRRQPATIRLG